VYVSPSSETSNDSAMPGITSAVPTSNFMRPSPVFRISSQSWTAYASAESRFEIESVVPMTIVTGPAGSVVGGSVAGGWVVGACVVATG